MNETIGYNMIKYLVPSDEGDEAWLASLKEMFPEELISEAKSINYKDDYYQNQINVLNYNKEDLWHNTQFS